MRLGFFWRGLLACQLLLWATLAHSACGTTDKVRIAFAEKLAPFAFDSGDKGIEIEIIGEALRRQGCTLVPVFMPLVRFGYALGEGKVDGLATISPASGIPAAYSQVYIEYHNVAVTLTSRKLSIQGIEDLKGLKVVAFAGAARNLGEPFRRFAQGNALYREDPKQINSNRLLYRDKVDVVIAERAIYAYLDRTLREGKFPEKQQPVSMHALFAPNQYHIGFRDPALRDTFNVGLSTLSKDDLKRIHERYR
jgi:ABC-type amino acid transport substrate-binding protein